MHVSGYLNSGFPPYLQTRAVDSVNFFNADPDTAAFKMRIRIQIQLKNFKKEFSVYEKYKEDLKKRASANFTLKI